MKIIIAGAGAVGTHLAELLSKENHDIVLIDENPEKTARLSNAGDFDLMTMNMSPNSIRTQKEAGVQHADLFIAVTPDEARNITCCMLAHTLGAKKTVARVDNSEYMLPQSLEFFKSMGIDSLIYPEMLASKGYVAYCDRVDSVNAAKVLPHELYLTNDEASLTEDAVKQHFAWIDSLGRQLQARPDDEALLLHRALDYYHVRDFENAIADLNALLQEHPARVVALMLRAQARLAQLESGSQTMSAEALRLGRLMVLQDYSRLAELAPDVPYVHYNKGHVQMLLGENEAALVSFTEALRLDSQFPDAYFNRGVAHLLLEQVQEGLSDLSQAGEYGLYHAYNLIKRYSVKK